MVELLFNALTQNKLMWTGRIASGIFTCEITLNLDYFLTWHGILKTQHISGGYNSMRRDVAKTSKYAWLFRQRFQVNEFKGSTFLRGFYGAHLKSIFIYAKNI